VTRQRASTNSCSVLAKRISPSSTINAIVVPLLTGRLSRSERYRRAAIALALSGLTDAHLGAGRDVQLLSG